MDKNYVTIIKPKLKWDLLDLRELWDYRELFYIFAWRDIKVRYKQTLLGAGWAILQPLLSMFIFTVFFGDFAKIPSGELPYQLFVLIGLVFWGLFSGILSIASGSLIANETIVKKIYFPREILPLSSIGTNLVDFCVAFVLLIFVSTIYGIIPNPLILLILPLGVVIAIFGAGGLGLFLSAFNIKYRDVRYALPFFIQMMVFLTPVIYPIAIMRPSFRYLIALNPMTGVIEAVRILFSGSSSIDWVILGIATIVSLLIFTFGLYYFKATERFFADLV